LRNRRNNFIFLDTTVFIDFFKLNKMDEQVHKNVALFFHNLREKNIALGITTPIMIETIKRLKCFLYKDATLKELKRKIRRLYILYENFNIDLIDFTKNEVDTIVNNLDLVQDCLCNCDAGEFSLLIEPDPDKLIIASSDNKCFRNSSIKTVDPRNYDGTEITKWLGIEDLYHCYYHF